MTPPECWETQLAGCILPGFHKVNALTGDAYQERQERQGQ
jgi:hypothetical protein